MAIVPLHKLTLCGLLDEQPEALAALQELGLLHLIPLNPTADQSRPEFAHTKLAHCALQALKYLAQCPHKRHQVTEAQHFDLSRQVKRVLEIQARTRKLSDKRDSLLKRIKEVEPWGNFYLPGELGLGGLKLWFYIVPKQLMRKLEQVDLVWQVVYKDNLFDYVVVIAEQEPSPQAMPVARTHTGRVPLAELRNELNETELALEDLQAERESLTRWMALIGANLNKAHDEADLKNAKALCLSKHGLFAIQAWAAAADLPAIRRFAERYGLALLSVAAGPGDAPPTLLENKPRLGGGEDLVNFYQTPNYFDWDPSPVVFFSFALFFAMIVSDAGYGALFGLLLALKWRPLGRSQQARRFRALALTVVLATVIWGVLIGSYFGYEPKPGEGVLADMRVFEMSNFDLMMQVSVIVGVGHIALANIIKAYRHRHSARAWAEIGWLLVVVAGYVVAAMPASALVKPAYGGLALGGLLILTCSSARPLLKPADWLWRTLDGLKSLAEITNLFGNVLSYLRLFALGMAGVSLALTFNQLAVEVYHAVPGTGLLLSLLILLLGHGLNILLCIMSGVVHGLRLNFIEFFNWSVSDEGYPFKAFAKRGAD